MGKDMTLWLFIGIFQGIVSETKLFQKEEQAIEAFDDFTGLSYMELTADAEKWEEFQSYNDNYTGSTIHKVQIEP